MGLEDDNIRRAQQRVGTVLRGKWTLERLLGVGGMAAVYAGVHRNGTRGAIKVLHPDLALDSDLRSRFLREGYAANSISHPGVVRVIDDDDDDGVVFLVMELLEGESFESRAMRHGGKLPPSEVLSLGDQVLDVLAVAHAAGVVHRDIKPENIFLTSTGQVKLLDFGIARIREKQRGPGGTQPGATMGTVVYMAPEQARGRWDEVDARTDLFAVGATMYFLISGRFIHEAETQNEQLLAAMSHRVASLADVAPDAPTGVIEVVDRSLRYERDMRWEDARAMQNAVRLAYHGLFGKPITTAPRLVVPDDAMIGAPSSNGRTTGGRVPPGLSRTTLGRYLADRRSSGLLIGGVVVVLLALAFMLSRRGGESSAVSPATASGERVAPTATTETNRRAPVEQPSGPPTTPQASPHILSPSDLPPADPESLPGKAKTARTPLAPKADSTTRRDSPPATVDTPPKATTPPKPTKADPLDQQW